MITKPVVALDIDGTLGAYHEHFTWFAEQWVGRPMPDPALNTHGDSFNGWLRMSRANYRQCKLAYRQGGMKRSMPVFPGASEATRAIRKKGAQIWICTTRPYLRLDNIDPDTRHWLRRNRIQYDNVIFGNNKYRELKKIVGVDNIIAVVDDLGEMTRQAKQVGINNVILRDRPYNRDLPRNETYDYRVADMYEMQDRILDLIDDWKGN